MKLLKTMIFAGAVLCLFAGCCSSKAKAAEEEAAGTETVVVQQDPNDIGWQK